MRNVLYRPAEARRPTRSPRRGLGGRLALGGGLAALLAIPFLLILLFVESSFDPIQRVDVNTANSLNAYADGRAWLVHTLDVGSVVFQPWSFRVVVLAVAAWLWVRGARRLAIWAVVTIAIGGVLAGVLKLVVARARPHFPEPVAHASGYSFPSGHAMNSMLGVAVLILIFLPVLTRTGRVIAYTLGGLVVLATGFDRVALGVHFVSDVVAGWIAALAVVAGTAGGFEIWRREQGRAPASPGEGVEPEAAPEISDGQHADSATRNH
ncbi:MAG TPA: phosphatase PAP2 family protein [Actinomycetes bacterium]|nr:phosphatase PAP2 family protein [Actinomycetes bacterium]